ncbi:hypothetical protein BO86DRAFT_376119 [Aspergillus japonicus CBS 114.51]|nr:hypothetical protein BO86DRAFT_376119 [Aspergillus japonicus CBS 114.51]RAH85802.1 hypothetical protein BO86DRAFT_376119 [Aspergillus japonicus CBS 114.51]
MLAKSLLLTLCATASTVVATTDIIHFLYATDSYSDIQGAGSGYSAGFTLTDDDGNTIYHNADPDGYSPCVDDSEKVQYTSDCFTGTWTFGCESAFDGSPKLCSAYDPDGTAYPGKAKESLDFIGISAGISGTCSGEVTIPGNTCTSDSTFKVVKRYTGNYKSV